MPDLVDIAGSILSQAQQRAEVIGENMANATTPAYRRRVAFSRLLSGASASEAALATREDATPGKLIRTGERFDLAVTGSGSFAVRDGDALHLTRAGRFIRLEDGKLADAQGRTLQAAAGSDLVVGHDAETAADGRMLSGGREVGRVALYVPASGASPDGMDLLAPEETHIVQGAYEASNVSTGEEMAQLMLSLRLAESGQRIMLAYDDIMGRAITAFGENVR